VSYEPIPCGLCGAATEAARVPVPYTDESGRRQLRIVRVAECRTCGARAETEGELVREEYGAVVGTATRVIGPWIV
jgi:hypothetical protein